MEYSVVFTGKILAGHDVATVRENVGKLFHITDSARLDLIFSGHTVVLKKGINGAKAEKYRAALEGAGALCELRLDATPAPAPAAPTPALVLEESVIAIPAPAPLPPVPAASAPAALAPAPVEPAPAAAASTEAEGSFTRLSGLKLGSLDDLVDDEPALHIPAPPQRPGPRQPLLELPDLLELTLEPASAPASAVVPAVVPAPAPAAPAVVPVITPAAPAVVPVRAPMELSLAPSSPNLPVVPTPPPAVPAPAIKLGSLEGMSLMPMDGEHAAAVPAAPAAPAALAGATVAAVTTGTASLRVGAPPPPPPPPVPSIQPAAAEPAKPAASSQLSPLMKEQLFNDARTVQSSFGGGGYMPDEAQGLCWGGFFFPWLWLRRHASWWGLPGLIIIYIIRSLIPWAVWVVLYVGAALFLLFKGREMAWNSRRWDSVETFNTNQRHWAIAGAVLALIQGYLVYSLVSYSMAAKAHPRVSPETAAIREFQQQQAAAAAARDGNQDGSANQPPPAGGMGDLTNAYLNSFKDPVEREKKRQELEAAAARDHERSANQSDRSSSTDSSQ